MSIPSARRSTTPWTPLMMAVYILCIVDQEVYGSQVVKATLPSYAPLVGVECPTDKPLVRLAGSPVHFNQTLAKEEQEFRAGRKSVVAPLWRKFFTSGVGAKANYASTALLANGQNDWPVLGIALSGGGERAALYGAGVLQALDARTESSPIRGVLQLTSDIAGLSGGSWLVTSLAANDYPPIPELVARWQLHKDLLTPGGKHPISNKKIFDAVYDDVKLKRNAGFNVSLSDFWGMDLAYHFLPGTTPQNYHESSDPKANGAGILFSALRSTQSFRSFTVPLPIVVSNSKPQTGPGVNPPNVKVQGKTFIPLSSPVYEFSPFEFGSYDPSLTAFTPTETLGTPLDKGRPVATIAAKDSASLSRAKGCVSGFDQASFVMGSSATLFNAMVPGSGASKTYGSILSTLIKKISDSESLDQVTTARYPNPFKGVNGVLKFDGASSDELKIVDGGENGENLPLNPLLVPARKLDVILASDASADTDEKDAYGAYWPNGASLINTFVRVNNTLPKGSTSFPPIPLDPQVWSKNGLARRPTFFGCNAPIRKGNGGYPLIIYLPNSPHTQSGTYTNVSTFKFQFSEEESKSFINSVMIGVTKPMVERNKTDENWSTCLACGLIDRARNRLNVARSDPCVTCFQKYCFKDGVKEGQVAN